MVWSFDVLKANSPFYAAYYQTVAKAEATGPHEVTFTFTETGNRELPQVIGQLRVLPKHWWAGNDANGKPRSVTETTLEIPLGSGPYRLEKVRAWSHRDLRAGRRLLGQGPARERGPQQLRHAALRVFP